MIRAQQTGMTPEQLIAASAAEHRARLRGVPDRPRPVPLDALGREPPSDARDCTRGCATAGPHRAPRGPSGLRRAGRNVPARSLRAWHLPALRHARTSMATAARYCGATYSPADLRDAGVDRDGYAAGVARIGASVLQARRPSSRCCANGWPAAACSASVRAKLGEWFEAGLQRMGHLARRAVFRLRDSRCPGKYFYVWFDAPIGYIGSFEALRAARGLDFDEYWRSETGERALPFHRQGHQLLPHAVLARRAARRRPAPADRRVRARLPHDQRPEDVEVARHFHHGAPLPRPAAARAAALLLRRQADRRHRGHRPQPRGLHSPVPTPTRRQAREHRQPLRRLHRARAAAASPRHCPNPRCTPSSPARASRIGALYEARDYAAAIREIMALADRANQYVDHHKPWPLARDPARLEEVRAVATQGINLFRVLMVYLAPVLPRMAEAAGRVAGTGGLRQLGRGATSRCWARRSADIRSWPPASTLPSSGSWWPPRRHLRRLPRRQQSPARQPRPHRTSPTAGDRA